MTSHDDCAAVRTRTKPSHHALSNMVEVGSPFGNRERLCFILKCITVLCLELGGCKFNLAGNDQNGRGERGCERGYRKQQAREVV